jgi:superoxide dismutase, Cu-Zn family
MRYGVCLMLGVVALTAVECRAKPKETAMPAAAGKAAPTASASSAPSPAQPPQHHGNAPLASAIGTKATAQLRPADAKSKISGTVTFTQEMGGVRVVADVSGLKPGKHGFHIHQNGVCASPFTSAGDHLNPFNLEHSCPPEHLRHLGDLGSIQVGPDGKGHYNQVVDKISVVDPHHLIVGKSVLVHAGPDDCKSQPSGGSGDRIACGVIQLAPRR